MVDATNNHEPASLTRINVQDEHDVTWWAEHFGISDEQLKAFVHAVGPMVIDVQEEIERVP